MPTTTTRRQHLTQELNQVVAALKTAHPGLVLQYRWIDTDTIHLDTISIPKTERNAGIGTKSMQALVDYATEHGVRIMLVPDSCFGSDLYRLRGFYARFGFNMQGRKMVFREMH